MIETEFLNRVELRGRVGHDPRVTSVGDASVARFSVATNEAFRGKNGELREETTWHNVTAYGLSPIFRFYNPSFFCENLLIMITLCTYSHP